MLWQIHIVLLGSSQHKTFEKNATVNHFKCAGCQVSPHLTHWLKYILAVDTFNLNPPILWEKGLQIKESSDEIVVQCSAMVFLRRFATSTTPTSWSRCQDASQSHTHSPGRWAGTASCLPPPALSCRAQRPFSATHGVTGVPLYLHQWSLQGHWWLCVIGP